MYTCLEQKDKGVNLRKENNHSIIYRKINVRLDVLHPGQFALVRPFVDRRFVSPGWRIIPSQCCSVAGCKEAEHQLTVQSPLQRLCDKQLNLT